MINDKIDSINFKNAIIQSQLELPGFAKDIKVMIIEEEYGNDYYGNLVIENYPNLEKIAVKKWALNNLKSLKICNNEKLKTIEIEDGKEWEEDGKWYNNSALFYVKNVTIESISI